MFVRADRHNSDRNTLWSWSRRMPLKRFAARPIAVCLRRVKPRHSLSRRHKLACDLKSENAMLRIDRDRKSLSNLGAPTLAEASITERYDLQEYIFNSPEQFFAEIGQELMLLGKEVVASQDVQDRIDLLAVDRDGACVVLELKRGNHKLHMLQAVSYAGMISHWTADQCLQLLHAEDHEKLLDFLECDPDDINRSQRIILLAEAYDFSLLCGAEWLSETYSVDIICCRLAIARDDAVGAEYLICTNIHPPPEISQQALRRGGRGAAKPDRWSDWDAALTGVTNRDLVEYVQKEVAAGRECYLKKRVLRYRIAGKRRWFLAVRNKRAYVWQHGRFDGDERFWSELLGDAAEVKPVKNGECLRMLLSTPTQINRYHEAATSLLDEVNWDSEFDERDEADADLGDEQDE